MTGTVARAPAPAPASTDLFVKDPSIRARRRENVIVLIARTVFVVALVAGWELLSGRVISEFWISRPSAIAAALGRFLSDGVLLPAIAATLLETVLGFALGSAAGVAAGLLLGTNRLVARIVDPFLVGINSIPRVALVPLFILWFGIGLQTKVVFSALLVFFPVFMNTVAGARDVDRDLVDVLRVMGASSVDVLRRVLVPSSLTWVFAGLRMSVPFALIGAVIAEMFTSNQGLGYLISLSANQYDTAGTFAALLVTTVLGLLLTGLVAMLEQRLVRWRPAL